MQNIVITDVKTYQAPSQRVLRVLVVDDNPDLVLSLTSLLRMEGHDARGLPDADDIVRKVQDFGPDVVVLDISMPGKDGWQAAKEIRAALQGARLVLVALTGEYTSGAHRAVSRARGFDFYFRKPCDPSVLLSLLRWVGIQSPFRQP
jgi:DNA-binding response OmpR family regulator